MDTPRLNGYPFDQKIVARNRARAAARQARSGSGTPEGVRAFLDWLVA